MTNQQSYIAWDFGQHPGPPPPGWWLAADGRWWPPDAGPANPSPPPPRIGGAKNGTRRSTKIARLAIFIVVLANMLVIVIGAVTFLGRESTADPSTPGVEFEYAHIGGPGFIDQTAAIFPTGDKALRINAVYVPLDASGEPVIGVRVETAFGSDRRLLIIPRDGYFEVFRFVGDRSDEVVGVRLDFHTGRTIDGYDTEPVSDPEPFRSGRAVTKFDPFDQVKIVNPNWHEAAFRIVCINYDSPDSGRAQQPVEIIEVVPKVEVPAGSELVVDTTDAFRDRTEVAGFGCASLEAHPTP